MKPILFFCLCAVLAIEFAVPASARPKKDGPALSPAALSRAFAQIGFVPGAQRTIEGTTVRVERLNVRSAGKWIVVRILPKRVP